MYYRLEGLEVVRVVLDHDREDLEQRSHMELAVLGVLAFHMRVVLLGDAGLRGARRAEMVAPVRFALEPEVNVLAPPAQS